MVSLKAASSADMRCSSGVGSSRIAGDARKVLQMIAPHCGIWLGVWLNSSWAKHSSDRKVHDASRRSKRSQIHNSRELSSFHGGGAISSDERGRREQAFCVRSTESCGSG